MSKLTAKEVNAAKPHGGERGVAVARSRGKSNSSAASASLIDVDKPLTDMQKMFVKLWAEGDSVTGASLRAGYADAKLAYRLARQPNILALKAQHEAQYQKAAQMTRERVMEGLLEAVEMAKLMSEPATMVSGWREIAKMCGYMAPVEHRMKVDVTGSVVLEKLNALSDAELLKIITEGSPQGLLNG